MVPEPSRAEHAALPDAFRAAPGGLRRSPRSAAPTACALPRLAHRIFNRVLGLDSIEPLDEIAELLRRAALVGLRTRTASAPSSSERGLRRDYGWMKFRAASGPVRRAASSASTRSGADRAADFARVVVGGYRTAGVDRAVRRQRRRPPRVVVLRRLRRRRAGRGGCALRRRRRRLARVRRDAAGVPGPRRPERDSRRPHRGRAPAGLRDGGHRDRRARRRPPVELVPQHPPGRLPRGRCPAELPRPLGLTLRRPSYADAMRVRGVSLALLVVAVVAAWAAQTAAARTPLQIGSVVPELLDPALQQSTVDADGQRGPRRTPPG